MAFSPLFLKFKEKIEKNYPGAFRPSTGLSDKRRIPTGIFVIDRLLGGGMPVARLIIICGHKATYKSTLAQKIIVGYQSVCNRCFLYPQDCQCPDGVLRLMAIYNDIEKTLDEGHMKRLGIDISPERFHLLRPAYGELACEYTQELAKTPEVGLVIVDSLAALVPLDEVEEGYTKDLARGLRARLMNRMIRVLVTLCDSPVPKTVVMINHLLPNQKTPGDYLPGGETQKMLSTVTLKQWTTEKQMFEVAKDGEEKVKKFGAKSEEKVGAKKQKVGFLIEHSKISPDNISGEYSLFLEDEEHIRMGDSDDWKSVFFFCQKEGLITEVGSSYVFEGERYNTQKAIIEHWQQDPVFFNHVKRKFYGIPNA